MTSYQYDSANRLSSVDGVNYTFDANGNLLSDGTSTYTYDSANRLTSVNGTSLYTYSGLGDRLSQTVNGVPTNYTLDLNAGLTQVLSDGTNVYTYGLGRISQTSTTTEYFLGDALGSVRQLTNNAGEVTLAKSYSPYGEVMSTSGSGTSMYAYTGEQQDGDMVYLRARFYNAADGRFLTKDPSGAESNLYLYGKANPINRTDPSGLYSSQKIFKNIPDTEFTHPRYPSILTNSWWERERWGFFMMLREAEDGNFFQMGSPKLFQVNPSIGYGNWHTIYSANCDTIIVDGQLLSSFYEKEVRKQREPLIWWRDTSATHYKLNPGLAYDFNQPLADTFFIDGAYQTDLPDFHSISVSLPVVISNYKGTIEVNLIVDMNGYPHLSIGGGFGSTYGAAYTEDYLCVTANCNSSEGISPDDVTEAINGICENQSAVLLAGVNLSALCHGWGGDFTSTSSFYLGLMAGYGIGATLTVPVGAPVPSRGWRSIENDILNGVHLQDVDFFD